MFKKHPLVNEPRKLNAIIWRYMDFTKFVSLLDKEALFFARADKIGDPFEGSHSRANLSLRAQVYKDDDDLTLEDVSRIYKLIREFTAVNCWHLNRFESTAMWKLYLKSNEGIAIRSTFERLRDSLKDEKHDIFIGKVKYVNFEEERIPDDPLQSFFYKRKSFKHEAELRAVIQELPEDRLSEEAERPFIHGVYIPIDLDLLIRKICLAPTSPKWLHELVESVMKKYGLNKELCQSSLDEKPIY